VKVTCSGSDTNFAHLSNEPSANDSSPKISTSPGGPALGIARSSARGADGCADGLDLLGLGHGLFRTVIGKTLLLT